MGTTSPHGIVYAESGGAPQAWVDSLNMANSIEDALAAYELVNSWTPVFNTGPTGLGSGGSAEGSYVQLGKLVIGSFQIVLGTSPTVSGTFELNLPVPIFSWTAPYMNIGSWTGRDDSPTVYYGGSIVMISTSPSRAHFSGVDSGTPSSSRRVSDTSPHTWAVNDVLTGNFMYRAA
ncbi:MAG TPA: hypothetical protein VK754_00545 [Propionibacteriaceae bacterium]|nr:hypothetical protein [Propionibacteriaceae bacterium]